MGFLSPIHKSLSYTLQMLGLVLQKTRSPERPQLGLASNKLPSWSGVQSLTQTFPLSWLLRAIVKKKNHKQPGHREGSQGGGVEIEERERGSWVLECRWPVASHYYTLTREEVGLNSSDNGGQREADSASQTFLSWFLLCTSRDRELTSRGDSMGMSHCWNVWYNAIFQVVATIGKRAKWDCLEMEGYPHEPACQSLPQAESWIRSIWVQISALPLTGLETSSL